MSETTTTTTTPAAAPAKKPKRPKSKSMIMASEQLKKAFSDTQEAKARGEMIGWATSLFPQEIPEALGLCIVYPENHSAGLAAQKATAPFLDYAEGVLGCNNDLCSYAKINLAYAELLECPGNNMPVPDFLLVANNGCAETTKWFELLSRKWNIPLFMIDLTYNHFEGVNEARCKYIAAQLRKLIDDLCKLTGKTWDDDDEVTEYLTKILNREAFDGKGLIYGIGHAVYTESDPRCVILKKYAQALSNEKGLTKEFELYNRVEGIAIKLMQQHRQLFKPICANVDFYSGFVYTMLGLPMELFTPIFAISRISGWCAHRIEELANEGKIIRPAYKYVGHHKDYVAIEDRWW